MKHKNIYLALILVIILNSYVFYIYHGSEGFAVDAIGAPIIAIVRGVFNLIPIPAIKDYFNENTKHEDLNKLNSNFPFRRSRFSKYSEAIKILKINTSLF